MTITQRTPATITLPLGKIAVVKASTESRGAVWRIPPNMYGKRTIVAWAEAKTMTIVGPYAETRTLRIEAVTGELEYEIQDVVISDLENQIQRIRSATVIAKALNEGKKAMSDSQTALDKVDAAANPPAKRVAAPGSFVASIRAMMDKAREGVAQARQDGLAQIEGAVAELSKAETATKQVSAQMAKAIADEAADVMAELGQISNMPPE